jgi:hypothetical protein
MLWLVILFSLLSFVIYQLLVVCSPCKVILMNFNTFLLCIVSFVLPSWWVSSFPCYVSLPYYTILVNFVAFFICIVSLLWVQSLAYCALPPCYALMEFFSIFFSCTSVTVYGAFCRFLVVHSQCSFELCLVPFQIHIYPSIFFNVEAWKKDFLQLLFQLPNQTSSNFLEEYFICFSFLKKICNQFFFIKIVWEK